MEGTSGSHLLHPLVMAGSPLLLHGCQSTLYGILQRDLCVLGAQFLLLWALLNRWS